MHNNIIQYQQCGAYLVAFIIFILLYKSSYDPVIEIHYHLIYIYNNNDIVMEIICYINILGVITILKFYNKNNRYRYL